MHGVVYEFVPYLGAHTPSSWGQPMHQSTHIDIQLVPPSELPPETNAEFTVRAEPRAIRATVRCATPQAAQDCFSTMLQAVRHVQDGAAMR